MGNIQSYRKFIQDTKKTYGEKILNIVWKTIIPGIQDILNDYNDHYDILQVEFLDEESNNPVSSKESHWENIDQYVINIYLEIGKGDAPDDMYKLISERILSEFGDDLMIVKFDSGNIQYVIK